MKILMCIDSLSKDGASRVFTNLANSLCKKHEIVFCCTVNNVIDFELPKEIRINNSFYVGKSRIVNTINRILKLRKIIKNEKPDIILAFLPRSSYMAAALKNKKNKLIISVRNDPSTEYSGKINNFLMKRLYIKADGMVFQTEQAREYFPKKIREKGVIIFNPLNPEFLENNYNMIERNKNIVSIGRLTKQKNQELLINAFSKIHKEFPDYKLVIYGYGELEEKLRKQINDLGLNDFVKLAGIVDDIKTHIYDSSMFVLSSIYEGMPNSLIEAMALGIPCISTDCPCGGPKELIQDGINGILIKNNDENELIIAMKTILKNKKFANEIGNNAKNIVQRLNPSEINKQWEKYLEKINREE